MTPSERERRIEAAWRAYWEAGPSFTAAGDKHAMRAALDAADEAVPDVAEPGCAYVVTPGMKRLADEHAALEERVEKAEAAARELYRSLADLVNWGHGADAPDGAVRAWRDAQVVLGEQSSWGERVHPSFSGEEGTAE